VRAHERAMAKDLNKQEQAILIDLLNRVARAG
jgi:hypothetical protein